MLLPRDFKATVRARVAREIQAGPPCALAAWRQRQLRMLARASYEANRGV